MAEDPREPICILGDPGAGKSAAIRYLRAVLSDFGDVALLDDPRQRDVRSAHALGRSVVFAATADVFGVREPLELARWNEDDWIEYLLARHPEVCGSVMAALRAPAPRGLFGHPATAARLLDQLAQDPGSGVDAAVLRAVGEGLDPRRVRLIGTLCIGSMFPANLRMSRDVRFHGKMPRLVRQQAVREILAGDRIAEEVCAGKVRRYWHGRFSGELIESVARGLRRRGVGALSLQDAHPAAAAMLASVNLALDCEWRPQRAPRLLDRARLAGATWPQIELSGVRLRDVELQSADLRGANLDGCRAVRVDLRNAKLAGASLAGGMFLSAWLERADLTSVRGEAARFTRANLRGAMLHGANLRAAQFERADLRAASLMAADLTGANLMRARVSGVNLRSARLDAARLNGLRLRLAALEGATFRSAQLQQVDLEGVVLEAAEFQGADLRHALLTGAQLPGADFGDADLRGAGLANITWRGARLQGADLRGATFHLGSSRSGKVESDLASEGSRTGFYTDEFHEQEFLAPEEIRKADLRDVDLRGAKIFGVDFYLVDLRGARYSADQRVHLEQTRAIL